MDIEDKRDDFKNNGKQQGFYIRSMPIFSACLSLHIYISRLFKKI